MPFPPATIRTRTSPPSSASHHSNIFHSLARVRRLTNNCFRFTNFGVRPAAPSCYNLDYSPLCLLSLSHPTTATEKKIFLLKPRGFCAGVVRAIDVVKIALDLYGPPVYVRKEIVHNKHVVDELREAGAIFVEELDEVPSGARAIFSAHGVAPAVRKQAKERRLEVIDATCPLVTKVHLEAVRFARDGFSIVLIGHKDHDEVIGTLGRSAGTQLPGGDGGRCGQLELPDPTRVRYLTQTTLSLDETRDIVDAAESSDSRSFRDRLRRISATPPRIARWR